MNSVRALAKLSISGLSMETGAGSVPEFTPEDIAAALAGCQSGPYYLGRLKYSGDGSVVNTLEKLVYSRFIVDAYGSGRIDGPHYSVAFFYLNHWPLICRKGFNAKEVIGGAMTNDELVWCMTLHQLARMLIDDVVFENRHKTCGGTGFYQYRVCKGCNGSGRKLSSVSELARRLNVSNHIYTRTWQPLFEWFVPVLQTWEQIVLLHLKRRLQEKDKS